MAHPHPREYEFEAQPGLPEKLPADERIVWQGAPDPWQLALHALHVRKLTLYFAAMMGLQAIHASGDGRPVLASLALSGSLAAVALLILGAIAWMAARTTLYTLTTKRIVMRIGIVLTVSYNLPLKQIAGASFKPLSAGFGEIALTLKGSDRIAWVHLWPHARAWHVRKPQPTLRCLPGAQAVAERVQQAWLAQNPGVSAQLGPQTEPERSPGLHTAVSQTAS